MWQNERGDRQVESNDSLEIPERTETSDIPGLPSGREAASVNKQTPVTKQNG